MYCFNNYKETMNIITGDGGFDFSSDYVKELADFIKTELIELK